MSKTIVVPLVAPHLDVNKVSQQALPIARALMARTDALVTLVSVIEVPREYAALVGALGLESSVQQDWIEERREFLEQIARTFPEGRATVVVRVGDPASELLDLARDIDDPVVVMTSHVRTGLQRALLGSVAYRVVHESEWPTIVVPASSEVSGAETARLQRILVPLDGSSFCEQALERMLAVLGTEGLELHLLHVIEPPALHPDFTALEYMSEARDWAIDYLAGVTERLSSRGITAVAEVRTGRIAEEIQRAARDIGADMIAMATHSRRGLQRVVFGSVAQRVLSESHVPLFLHRPMEAAQVEATRPAEATAAPSQPRLVSEVMSPPVMAVREGATLEEAERLMREHGTDMLPVVDWRSRLVGVIRRSDLPDKQTEASE
nr:MAG: hypothetical protein DIU58_10795 [Sphaerobacter thermophilus]